MAQGNGGGGAGWDYYDIIRKNTPAIGFNNHRKGTCHFRMHDKTLCGEPFAGPPNRKYCDSHSSFIRYSGRSPESNVA